MGRLLDEAKADVARKDAAWRNSPMGKQAARLQARIDADQQMRDHMERWSAAKKRADELREEAFRTENEAFDHYRRSQDRVMELILEMGAEEGS